MSFLSNIFALASATLYIRSQKISPSNTELLLKRLSYVFADEPESSAAYLYNLYKSKKNLLTVSGFDNDSEWQNLENLIDGNLKTKIGLASLIYSFSVFPSLDPENQEYLINKFNSYINSGSQISYIPYSKIENVYKNFSYINLNNQISKSPKDYDTKIVNYNWYDAESLFIKPELDSKLRGLIKDSENQYYYLSGEILYQGIDITYPTCIKQTSIISTSTGDISTTIYSNFPCFDSDTYIGPVTGIKFFRIFNDGPPSSGYFDSGTMQAYIEFDEAISNKNDYFSNKENVYSFQKDETGNYIYLCKNVQTDFPGSISSISSSGEYGNYRTNWITDEEGCRWTKEDLETLPLMRMHQGDNLPKYHYYKIKISQDECQTGVSGPLNWTGWKFVNFELKDSWSKHFNFINTNPRSQKDRFLKRALNIENYLDKSVLPNEIHSPYLNVVDTGDGVLSCLDYIGYPQLNSSYCSLPGFVFHQTFDNINFGTGNTEQNTGEYASINIYPAISRIESSETGSKSNRSFDVSKYSLFSGKDFSHSNIYYHPKINIQKTINASEMTGYDNIFKKCIAIGDNFQNKISGASNLQSNAGYVYTGYTFYQSGNKINLSNFLSESNTSKVAGTYSEAKYITGYLDLETNEIYSISAFSAHFLKGKELENFKGYGDYLVYYYFNTLTGNGSINSVNTGWSTFAPIPEGIFNNQIKYKPLYDYQKVENYFPRYSSGPFATYENKILYPNANEAYIKYNSKVKGFPNKISYVIKIKEESVREICGTSGIRSDSFLKNQEIIRAGLNYSVSGLKTLMINPFIANTLIYSDTYNFHKNKSLYSDSGSFLFQANLPQNYVNSFYIPNSNFCNQKQLNSTVYNYFNNQIFSNGIALTGNFIDREVYVDNKNTKKIISVIEPRKEGLFWGYKGKILSGNLLYTSPLFDLSSLTKRVNSNMLAAFIGPNKLQNIYDSYAVSNDGFVNNERLLNDELSYNGKDPIFYEYIGGRIGFGSELEGGYHRKGIIGDSWYDFSAENIHYTQFCGSDTPLYRDPYYDKYLILASLNSGSFDIFTKGLYYFPYYLDYQYKPFRSSVIDGISEKPIAITPIKVENEYYYNIDLRQVFNLKEVASGQLFYENGFEIGPFDRDVELCLLSGNSIIPSGNFIIDGKFLTQTGYLPPEQNIYCYFTPDIVNRFSLTDKIAPGEGGRNKYITTFKLIPSGKKININISGNQKIGFSKSAIITIRPRTNICGVVNDSSTNISGDYNTLDSLKYINNGSECKFSFKYNEDINELINKKFEYLTKPSYEVLYPVPNQDFEEVLNSQGLIQKDSFGNKIYKTQNGPTFDYWKIVNPNLEAIVLRNVSKISFEITSLEIEYGDIPFQSHKVVVPSGSCIISGEFSYTGQAESALVSQGIFLSGISGARSLTGVIDPYYISDVLKRLPSGIETFPSGFGLHPVLEAPSYMRKRENYFSITSEDKYINVFSKFFPNYNKFIWPALSDLALLNPDVVYEQIPPDDGTVFSNNYIHFSASQGQVISSGISGLKNPNENVTYEVKSLYVLVDSTSTNSNYNTGKSILKKNGGRKFLDSGVLSGILIADSVPLSLRPLI